MERHILQARSVAWRKGWLIVDMWRGQVWQHSFLIAEVTCAQWTLTFTTPYWPVA